MDESKIRKEALERAPTVWPPRERDDSPVSEEEVTIYLKSKRLRCEDATSLSRRTRRPELYVKKSVLPRLTRTLSRLPRDFFSIFQRGEREVTFIVSPAELTASHPVAETRPYGPGNNRFYVIFLKGVMELQDTVSFDGVIIHELCHVVLDHPAAIAWPIDPNDQKVFADAMEKEAMDLAISLGFVEETEAFRHLLSTMAEEGGHREYILPSGRIKSLDLERRLLP